MKPAHCRKLGVAPFEKFLDGQSLELLDRRYNRLFEIRHEILLRDDFVDRAEFFKLRGGDFERRSRFGGLRPVAPDDTCATLRRNDGIDGILEHENLVADRYRQSAAAAAFTGHNHDDRRFERGEKFK